MDPDGEFADGAELLLLRFCTFAATAKGIGRLLSGFQTTTSLIIKGFTSGSYGFWKVDLGIGKSLWMRSLPQIPVKQISGRRFAPAVRKT
jgi:hypothetical protein